MSTGSGPDAIRGRTFHEIQIEQAELDGLIRSRKPGTEMPVLPPGDVPFNPNNVWNIGDRGPPDEAA